MEVYGCGGITNPNKHELVFIVVSLSTTLHDTNLASSFLTKAFDAPAFIA